MKKRFLIVFVCVLLCCNIFVSVTSNSKLIQKENILSSSTNEVFPNSSFSLNMDFSNISVSSFIVQLYCNMNLDNPILENTNIDINSKVEDSNTILELTVNKEDLNLSNLSLLYTIPENISINSTLQFIVQISSNDEIIENSIEENSSTIIWQDSISISVVQNSSTNTDITPEQPFENSENHFNKITQMDSTINTSSKSSINLSMTQTKENSVATMNSSTSSVTYNGSSNNYLSTLCVDGFSFTKNFTKTNSSYFVTVPANTSSINILAKTENSSATICTYGNTNLATGINKILVNVTAENGSVRVYRIYVTVLSE